MCSNRLVWLRNATPSTARSQHSSGLVFRAPSIRLESWKRWTANIIASWVISNSSYQFFNNQRELRKKLIRIPRINNQILKLINKTQINNKLKLQQTNLISNQKYLKNLLKKKWSKYLHNLPIWTLPSWRRDPTRREPASFRAKSESWTLLRSLVHPPPRLNQTGRLRCKQRRSRWGPRIL